MISTLMWNRAQACIAADAMAAYLAANTRPNGKRYKRHRPHLLTARADALVVALGKGDREPVAALLLYQYGGVVPK